jgi:hypothetical protein
MVLISHRYQFIFLKNFGVKSNQMEAFLSQFCIDPAIQNTYDINNMCHEQINQYGIISKRVNKNTISDKKYFENIQIYKKYKESLYNNINDNYSIPSVECMWFNFKNATHIKEDIGDNIFTQYIKFCIVCNPYTLIVRFYINYLKTNPEQDFNSYCISWCNNLSNNYDKNDHSRIFLDGLPICNYYIRYENIHQDTIIVLNKLGINEYCVEDIPNYDETNPIDNPDYRSYYFDDIRDIVYTAYKDIIDYFGYKC